MLFLRRHIYSLKLMSNSELTQVTKLSDLYFFVSRVRTTTIQDAILIISQAYNGYCSKFMKGKVFIEFSLNAATVFHLGCFISIISL